VLTPTDKDPRPRRNAGTPVPLDWPVRSRVGCPPVVPPIPQTFAAVLEARRSIRVMQRAPLRELVNALAFATRPRALREGDVLMRSRRPSPSAGALHPIELVLVDWRGRPRVMRYDAFSHQLELLTVADPEALRRFIRACGDLLPEVRGTALVLIGHASRVAAVYETAASLLWRDAGALTQTLFLTATAFRLAFCPLGILGHEVVQALGLPADALATGAALMGRSP
jgi:SagB-type dehydrogenase family enzyme